MPAAPLPPNESERLEELRALDLLDTVPEQAYDDLTMLAAEVTGAPIALMSLVDENRQWFKSRVGLDVQQTPREDAFCAHAILEPTQLTVVRDASLDPRFADNPLVTGDPKIRFYAGTPLVTSRGHVLGTLCVIDQAPLDLDDDQRAALIALGRQVVSQIELRRSVHDLEAADLVRALHEKQLEKYREQLEEQVRQLAELSLRDPLTGLYNRTALADRLSAELSAHRRTGRPVAVVMIDIDHFKKRNDDFGHVAGDEALKALSRALEAATRESDTAARYGGEEFTVVLADTDADGAWLAAERMRLAVERIDVPGDTMTASFGIAVATPGRTDAESMLKAADDALYEAKAAGRNRVQMAAWEHSDAPN